MKTTYLIIIFALGYIQSVAQTNDETIAVEKIEKIFNDLNGNIFNQEKLELIQKNLMQLSFENEVLFTKTNYLDPENYINFYADNRVFNYADFMERAYNKLITVEIDKTSLYSSDRLDTNFMIYIDLYFRNDKCELIEN